MSTELAVVIPGTLDQVEREGFGSREIERRNDTQGGAIAAREQAAIQARYVMALQRQRNMDQVRTALLDECKRTRFAEVARYRKPVGPGKFAEGWSVRFAEAAKRCLRNVSDDAMVVYESAAQRIVRFSCADLESNTVYTTETVIPKTVERRSLKDGQSAISERKNSKGESTYTVYATDDEVAMKQASAWSKFIRNCIRFVPGDILDECLDQINATLAADDRKDPPAARKRIIDSFHSVGVEATDLQMLLGHPLTAMQPKEMEDLRGIYAAIRDGEATWREICDARHPGGSADAANDIAKERIEKAKAENAARRAAQEAPKAEDPKAGDSPAPAPSAAPIKEYDEFPDPMEFEVGQKIYVAGKLYGANAERNGWNEVVQEPSSVAQKPKFQMGRR